jgi:hypothetical protein
MANSNGWGDGAANNAIGWGQGANNNIGWGKSHSLSSAGLTDIVGLTTDSDAQAFITAAAITDATQQSAIDTLVKGLKTDGIWIKMKAIYPFVGGTATTHKYNLKDPRDLDAAFRLVFNGGWTHSSTGATPNGTNGYADTKLNPTTVLTNYNAHSSTYNRTDNNNTGWQIGLTQSASGYGNEFLLSGKITNESVSGLYNYFNATTDVRVASSSAIGYFQNNITSNTSQKLYKNGAQIGVNTSTNTSTPPSGNIFLSAVNDVTTSIPLAYSTSQQSFASIGNGLTDTDAANLYTRVQAYQTALSRQV